MIMRKPQVDTCSQKKNLMQERVSTRVIITGMNPRASSGLFFPISKIGESNHCLRSQIHSQQAPRLAEVPSASGGRTKADWKIWSQFHSSSISPLQSPSMAEIILPAKEQALRTRTLSSRGLDDYLQICDLTLDDLKGKRILDLGSGPDCRFATELSERIDGSHVTSLDAVFDDPLMRHKVSNPSIVGGYFTALPFADASFDLVLSCFAMPLYVEGEEAVALALKEVCRVLATGGKAVLAPLQFHRRTIYGEPLENQRELADALAHYEQDFPVIVSPTIVQMNGIFYESVLSDVLYDEEPATFAALLDPIRKILRVTIDVRRHPDLRASNNRLVMIERIA